MKKEMRNKDVVCYGLGMIGQQSLNFIVNAYLLYYINVLCGVPVVTIGVVFLIARVWDSVNDPMMGVLSDKLRPKLGSYNRIAFIGFLPTILFTIMCFRMPHLGLTGKTIYFSICYIMYGMAFTSSRIPFGAMVNVITDDYKKRAKVGVFRELGSTVGQLLASYLEPMLLAFILTLPIGNQENSYTLTAIIISALSLGFMCITLFGTKEYAEPPKQSNKIKDSFKALKGNWQILFLYMYFFIVATFYGIRMSFNAYYANYYLMNPKGNYILTAMSLSPLLILFFIPKIVEKIGKRNLCFIGALMLIVSGVMFLISQQNMTMNLVSGLFAGWGQVISFSAVWSCIGDAVDYSEYLNGVKAPGFLYSFLTFSSKMGQAIATFLISIFLSYFGFSETLKVQSAATQHGLMSFNWVSTVICGVLAILAIFPYKLTAKRMSEIRASLNEHSAQETDTPQTEA